MRVLFHKEVPFQRDEVSGCIVVETEPSKRTTYFENMTKGKENLFFPYVQFTICYTTIANKTKYKFYNIHDRGLRVFFTAKPLNSLDDKIFYPWTDFLRKGCICLDHRSDGDVKKSLHELVEFFVTGYFSLCHRFIDAEILKILKVGIPEEKDLEQIRSKFKNNDSDGITFLKAIEETLQTYEENPKAVGFGPRDIVKHFPSLQGEKLIDKLWSKDWGTPSKNSFADAILNLQKGLLK